jgi:hypothetical protein
MQTTYPSGTARTSLPPIPGTLSYYPAEHRGKFPSVRAALASIGCTGEAAAVQIENARVNASPSIAVPVKVEAFPDGEFLAVVVRRPGGKADLWLGLLDVADEDREFVADAARQFAKANNAAGRRSLWSVFEWTRQTGSLQ